MDAGHFESFEAICHGNDSVLILGTMPSPASIEKGFYYSHTQNRFWRMLATLFHETVPDSSAQKKDLLQRKGIAIWDVLAECDRKGAGDSTIANGKPNDIPALIAENPHIKLIACNGAKAWELYQKYFKETIATPARKMPSTSPANAACSFDRLCDAWSVILNGGE